MHLDVLFWLFVAHCVADYPLQTDFMALRKIPANSLKEIPWYYVMTAHAGVHAGAVALATNPLLGLCEFVVHWCIDDLKCAKLIDIHVDQALHIFCKVGWWVCFLYMQGAS